MKRNLFGTAVLSVLFLIGAGSAKAQVDKGYEVKPMSPEIEQMCQQVIDLQIDDPDQGNKIFGKVLKKISKDKDQLISVGDFFLNKNVFQVAKMCADQCYKLDPQYIPGLMFAGIMNKSRGFVTGNEQFFGLAGQKFEEVLNLDSTNVAALYQNVTIYKRINPAAAEDYLKKIATINPNDFTVEKDLGDIRYGLDNFPEAVEHYKRYFELAPQKEWDELAAQNYVNSIASGMDFQELGDVSRKFTTQWPKDIVFRRMIFMSDVFMGTETAGESVGYLTDTQYSDSDFIFLDYSVANTYYKREGDYESAIKYLKRGLEKDPARTDSWAELASLYLNNGQAKEAVETYKKFFAESKEPQAVDYYRLGGAYYNLSREEGITAEQQAEYLAAGDEAFLNALKVDPTMYGAAQRRALLYMTSQEEPLDAVRERFEYMLSLFGDNNDEDIQGYRDGAYSYLVWYHYMKEDLAAAKRTVLEWEKYNPTNETMQQFKAALE